MQSMLTTEHVWTAIGFIGQGLFFMRFFVQWLASEKARRSVTPVAFWYFSLGGGLIVLVYTIHLRSLPLILGQAMGLVIYSRNLYLIHRKPSASVILSDNEGSTS